jgi:hypothetical protein
MWRSLPGAVHAGGGRLHPGRAVQVDPIKTMLKAPGTKRLKLKCDDVASSFAFNFNLRRYILSPNMCVERKSVPDLIGRGLHSSTFQLNLSAVCGIGGATRGCLGVFRKC